MVRKALGLVGAVAVLGIATACEPAGGKDGDAPTVEDDVAEFDALAAELEADLAEITSGAAQDYAVAGSRLTWQDAGAGNPVLKSFDDETGDTLTYRQPPYWPGSPGSPSDNMNFVASTGVVASMNTMDSVRAWDPATGDDLGELVVPAPPYGQKWWAYGADGGDVYVAIIAGGHLVLQRWTPGQAQARDVARLDELIAPNTMGEFTNFAVSGDTVIFAEGGRVWIASMSGGKADWIQNDQYVGAVEFTSSEVTYTQGDHVYVYDRGTDSRIDLTDRIAAAYTLNATYPEPHLPTGEALTRMGDVLVYQGTYGLFAFDVGTDEAWPVLLDHRDNSVVWRYPTGMPKTGAFFAKGLESASGAIGADGPTWRGDLPRP